MNPGIVQAEADKWDVPGTVGVAVPHFDFDMDKVVAYAHMRNPNLKIFPISAKTGEGVDAWCDWLREQIQDFKA